MTKPDDVGARNIANYATDWSAAEYTRDGDFWDHERRLIEEYFPKPPARVLDLGCGAGRTTSGFLRRGYETVAVDLSQELLDLAKKREPQGDFRLMNACELQFPDASFDAVMFSYNGIDCIHPVEGRLQSMREAYRVLKPGGPFLLSSHNYIGSLFSGGFFYLWGHWNALKSLAFQVGNPLAWQWYPRYRDGGGVQHLYSAPPARTVKQLQDCGFLVEMVRAYAGEENARKVYWHHAHVHFAARKPA